MKRIALLVALVGAALVLPAGAEAATLTNAAGTLTYTAGAGKTNMVGFDQPNPANKTVNVYRFTGDDDAITPTGCIEVDPDVRYLCTNVTNVVADAGDGDDTVDAGGAAAADSGGMLPQTILRNIGIVADLGTGDDQAAGGLDDDVIHGGAGDDQIFLDGLGFGTMVGGDDQGFGDDGNDGVNGGRGADSVDGGEGNDNLGGGPGTDQLAGGSGDDTLGGGPDNDTLRGGDGNDTLTGECDHQPCPPGSVAGADDVGGGAGFDLFRYETYGPGDVTITLDDLANDGIAGEGDNIRTDVEDVQVTGPGDADLTGDAAINTLSSGDGDDVVNSRDGAPDRVSCGAGTDVANVDDPSTDIVSPDCETVNRATVVDGNGGGGGADDKAPTVAWSAPASGASLSTRAPNPLSVAASDDKGIAQVQFLDDERTVCADATAPYTCDYKPQGDDVGRNTLVAVAVDTAGQTASAVRAVLVPRFAGALSAKTSPKRDTKSPYRFTTTGRLTLPSGVTPAQGCRGTITVQIKAGRKTVSTRRVKLRSSCTYRSRVTFRLKQRLRPRTLARSVRFGGNAVLGAKSAKRRTLRVRT